VSRPRITVKHVRALTAPGSRGVLVLAGEQLQVVSAETAAELALSGAGTVLCTRADVMDTVSYLRGRPGVTNAVSAAVAMLTAGLNAAQ
jgi:hypothetical protein